MTAFQRFARSFVAVREADFLVVGASLLAALAAYSLLPALGGALAFHPGLGAFSSLGVLGVSLLLGFFGLPLAIGAYAAVRPGELRGIAMRIAVLATLAVQALVALVAATIAFAYATLLLATPEAVDLFGIPHASPWELHLTRLTALLVLARVLVVLSLMAFHRGTAYVRGDEPRRVVVAAVITAVGVIVVARLAGQLSSFALVDAWAAAGLVAALFRGPTQEA